MSGLFGDWEKASKFLKTIARNADSAADRAVRDEAFLFLRLIKDGFVKQGIRKKWKDLSNLTLEIRKQSFKLGGRPTKGTKALIRTGTLRRAFIVERKGDARYQIGVDRNAKSKAGKPMADIADIHERGRVIRVTDDMRKFFMMLFLRGITEAPLAKSTTKIVIPARPFFLPAHRIHRRKYRPRLAKRWASYLFGKGRLKVREAGGL